MVLTAKSTIAQRMSELLRSDLGFHDKSSTYASHNFHAFAAKFPPQLPRAFIENLTSEDETVLDPMVGSGTTLVEALLLGRRAVGVDIDPLAIELCKVKTTRIPPRKLLERGSRVIAQCEPMFRDGACIEAELDIRFDDETREFIDYWFLPETQTELMSLVLAIEAEADVAVRRFLKVVFSSVIVTKSGGVSLARDLAHTRPHRVADKHPKNAIQQFKMRFEKARSAITDLPSGRGRIKIKRGDARDLTLPDESVDLVVTSPPYANAIDYMRAHKFSLVWFGNPIPALSKLRGEYVGSERQLPGADGGNQLPPKTKQIVQELSSKDGRKSRVLEKYFCEMREVLSEIRRVLKRGRAAVVVVGTSTMRGLNVMTHECLAEVGEQVGLGVEHIAERNLDRNRRMMPARFGSKNGGGIEARMYSEHVIGFFKK